MKRVLWFILVMLLAACGQEAAPTATAVPPTNARTETVAAPELLPTPQSRPTSLPATPAPTQTAEVPELVWLPYASGNFGEPVLVVEDEEMARQDLPVDVEIYFDYHEGWLAYGSYFWEATADLQSVTDLNLYNFATGIVEQWAEGNIGRAAISPVSGNAGELEVAVAVHLGDGFALHVFSLPRSSFPLIDDIDPYFSWSPDGRQIAYVRDNELFVTDAAADSGNPPIASGVYATTGWIGDAPLWLGDSDYLLYADAPFTIVRADGSETIVPTAVDGTALEGSRPLAMLYSPTTNQLVAQSEGMFGPSVAAYQFGGGFETAVLTQQIDDAQLAGWYEEGESVIVVSGGEPTILPLTPPE